MSKSTGIGTKSRKQIAKNTSSVENNRSHKEKSTEGIREEKSVKIKKRIYLKTNEKRLAKKQAMELPAVLPGGRVHREAIN